MTTGAIGQTGETAWAAAGLPGGGHVHGDADLPVNPYLALRVTFGMLLGEDDFRVLMGNPRGKQMLHAAWLHGRGVVWGLGVARDGDQLVVQPGMAVDGHGRELHLDVPYCRSLQEWADEWRRTPPEGTTAGQQTAQTTTYPTETTTETTTQAEAWLVAEFAGCLDRPVPALADPCDVSRKHTDYSRVLETAAISIRRRRPGWPRGYHRVRALLALEPLADGDDDVRAAIAAVEAAPPDQRAIVLLKWFRRLAARDATERAPALEPGDPGPGQFPVTENDAAVVLARLTMEVTDHGACVTVGSVRVDPDVRTALIPTAVLQELACGRAPNLFGVESQPDAGGPRLRAGSVTWSRGRSRVSFAVTDPIAEGSQENGIEVSSLSSRGRGWAPSHIDHVSLQNDGLRVVVDLDESPAYPTVRLVIRGTGATPLYGRDPLVPFAGVEGGPPGTALEGHDAIDVQQLYPPDREERDET